jgi:hypothetical protein
VGWFCSHRVGSPLGVWTKAITVLLLCCVLSLRCVIAYVRSVRASPNRGVGLLSGFSTSLFWWHHDENHFVLCMATNFLFTFFVTYIINCINLCAFLQLCKYYVGVICTKGKNEQMWNHIMSLVTIEWKCVSNTQKNEVWWNNYNYYNYIELCFYYVDMFEHAHLFFLLHCGLHSFKVLHKKCYSFHFVEIINWKI